MCPQPPLVDQQPSCCDQNDLLDLKIHHLLDNHRCYETIRKQRWPDGVICPFCQSCVVVCNGHDEKDRERQRYICRSCNRRFDDLTGTVFAGHHQPVCVWMTCLYLMGLNLSNRQIAQELDLSESDAQQMTECLRHGLAVRVPDVVLEGEVEIDEVYIVAGHKGNPEAVKKKDVKDVGGV